MSKLPRGTPPSITAFIAPRVNAQEKHRCVSSVNAPMACSLLTAHRDTYRSKREPREPISDSVEATVDNLYQPKQATMAPLWALRSKISSAIWRVRPYLVRLERR